MRRSLLPASCDRRRARHQVLADEPDNRVLEAAAEARVDAVVTGDGGLLTLGDYDGIPIMSAAQFREWSQRHQG